MFSPDPRLLWLALLAPLAGAAAAAWLWRRRLAADAAWASRALWDRLLPAYAPGRLRVSVTCLALAVLGTSLALARPRWGAGKQEVERRGVDVVFLIDSSLSMASADVPPSRLYVAKSLVRRMARAMPGDRVGLGGGLQEKVARLREEGVVVHAFGIGTPSGAPVPIPGAPGSFKRDEEGNIVMSRLHEDVLENMARATGGSYTRVTSAALDPAPVLQKIDRMEKRTVESQEVTTLEERFQWPLALAALALVSYLALGSFTSDPLHRREDRDHA